MGISVINCSVNWQFLDLCRWLVAEMRESLPKASSFNMGPFLFLFGSIFFIVIYVFHIFIINLLKYFVKFTIETLIHHLLFLNTHPKKKKCYN